MKDLNRYVTRKYADDWYDIGLEVGLEFCSLKNIEKDNSQNSVVCLRETLDEWLKTGDVTWKTLEIGLTNVNRVKLGLDPVNVNSKDA